MYEGGMTAMKKRLVSLLCTLALCLGLLPVTALAAAEGAPNNLYVGNQNVKSGEDTTYWTTDDSGGLVKSDETANWTVRYNPNTATLTLNGATITGSSDSSVSKGAGIYALCYNGNPVSLTIELIGTNTITGSYGIYLDGHQGGAICTNASVLIKNGNDSGESGSLTVNGTSNHGIYIISGTGNASLTIENASVVANATSSYGGSGVCVQSGASSKDSPKLSLAVNGGSLTTSDSASDEGIKFYVGASEANSATTSLTVNDNAIVDARTGGISASGVSVNPDVNIGSTGSTGGIVFDGTEGTVYGDVTLGESLTIGEGETLTIPEGSTLNTNNNLTNNGTVTIENGGTLNGSDTINNTGTINVENGGKLEGTPTGTVVYAPTITTQPAGQEVTVGQTATFTVAASGESLTYQWQYSNDNGTNWNDISGATGNSYITDAATLEMNNYQYQCVVSNSAGSVTSDPVTLTVNSVPVNGVILRPDRLDLFTGDNATLKATIVPDTATNQDVTWSSSNDTIAIVDETGTVTAVAAGEATITVTTVDGGKQATCTVKVTQATYSISADTSPDFGSVCPGYTRPAARIVTVTNTGNQTQTLTQPVSTASFEVGALSKTQLAPGEKAAFTVQPKAGLTEGTYKENILISGSGGAALSVTAAFTVKHDLEKVAAKASTCTEAGNTEYWTCKVCGKTFSDAEGKKEITRESTVIQAAGHRYENGKCTVCGAADPDYRPAAAQPAATPLPYYILHFNTMGGYPLADVTFGEGASVELWPYNPVRPGYLFQGWYTDEALTKPVSTVVLVRETTVYAKWAVDPAAQAAGSSTGSSGSGSGSGAGSKATAAPSPTATPTATPEPTPTATPTPTPTATPEATPQVASAPDEAGNKGGFPVLPVALGAAAILAGIVAVVILRRRV